ncbi:MAG: ABC transporter, partial [Myxococcales bacterium]
MIGFLAARSVMMREFIAYRKVWWVFLSGFLEPVFYLFSIGIGVGGLIHGFEFNGETVSYAAFVAPAMMAASAFNGGLLDSTFNFFFKFKVDKLFEQQLATPLTTRNIAHGNLGWMVARSGCYSAGFLAIMGLMGYVSSWWAVLAVPAALLIGFAIAAVGMAAATFMRSFQDFEFVTLVQLPMFLFSA